MLRFACILTNVRNTSMICSKQWEGLRNPMSNSHYTPDDSRGIILFRPDLFLACVLGQLVISGEVVSSVYTCI